MSITFIKTDFVGESDVHPRLVRIISDDVLAVVTSLGYLNEVVNNGYPIFPTDFIFMKYSDGESIFLPSISLNGDIQLSIYPTSSSGVSVTDDNATNADMFPLWVSGTSGTQSIFLSSSKFIWNPGTGILTVGNEINLPALSVSQLVATNGSKNLVSAGSFGTDFNGILVASTVNVSATTILNSQSYRMANFGFTSGKINFTATNINCTILVTLPFGTNFTAPNQASGTISIGGNGSDTGVVGVIDSVSGTGFEINMLLTSIGTYDLYFTCGYSISN